MHGCPKQRYCKMCTHEPFDTDLCYVCRQKLTKRDIVELTHQPYFMHSIPSTDSLSIPLALPSPLAASQCKKCTAVYEGNYIWGC